MYCHVKCFEIPTNSNLEEKSLTELCESRTQFIILDTAKKSQSSFKSLNSIPSEQKSKGSAHMNPKIRNRTFMINPDCYVQLIMDYIHEEMRLNDSYQLDLADENAVLMNLSDLRSDDSGLKVLVPKATYVVVLYEKDQNGKILQLNPLIGINTKSELEYLTSLLKNSSITYGPSKMSRLGTSISTKSTTSRRTKHRNSSKRSTSTLMNV